jgi:hypothetical protein
VKRILGLIKDTAARLLTSYKRYPEPLLLAAAVVMILIITNHQSTADETNLRIAMSLALGVPLTLCFRALQERSTISKASAIAVYVITAAFLFSYYNYLLPELRMVTVTRYIAINLAFYVLFLTIPYMWNRDGFEFYVLKMFASFAVTFVYALVLYLGLVAILGTIDILFSVEIDSKLYFDFWLVVAGIFAPAYFLAGVPEFGVEDSGQDYPKSLQILLLYIVLPLITAYTAILYAYFIKIIVTRIWPEIMVSHLVLWYSLISTVVIFFIYIIREENSWANIFIRFFPKLILPILLMMFVAMGIRINAYGITENRYLVLVGGLWTTGSMLYYAFKKKTANIRIVLAVSILALLTVAGPWSAYAVSKYSQNQQMNNLLIKNQMLVDGAIIPSTTVPAADQNRIVSIIEYFNRKHSLQDLKVLPDNFTLEQMEETFGLSYIKPDADFFAHYPQKSPSYIEVQGYDYYFATNFGLQNELQSSENISAAFDGQMLRIAAGGQVLYEKDLTGLALEIHAANIGQETVKNEEMIFVEKNEKLAVKLFFHHIHGHKEPESGKNKIDWMEFSVLLKVF